MLSFRPAKSMVLFRVIINGCEWVWVKRLMNLSLRLRWTEFVFAGDVQHQWTAEILRFGETLFDTHSVVANRTIRPESDGEQVGKISTHTKPYGPSPTSA